MDKAIDARFERLETALAKLLNSISAYNPAPALATDLVAADVELSEGLEQLSTHQKNYAKIVSLRNRSSALDLQIKETLTLLTDTRRALLSTISSTFPETTNPVSYSELLSYARRISKFTLPATYRELSEVPTETAEGSKEGTPKEAKSEPHTNGTSTPVTNGVEKDVQMGGTAIEADDTTPAPTQTQSQTLQDSQNTTATSATSLPQGFAQYLSPLSEIPFFPWPTEETIRRGALASIQILLDQNIDPATFDPEKSAELEAERERLAEEEDRAREEQRVRMEEERRREVERKMSTSAASATPGRPEERPKVFQLDTLDDDESD